MLECVSQSILLRYFFIRTQHNTAHDDIYCIKCRMLIQRLYTMLLHKAHCQLSVSIHSFIAYKRAATVCKRSGRVEILMKNKIVWESMLYVYVCISANMSPRKSLRNSITIKLEQWWQWQWRCAVERVILCCVFSCLCCCCCCCCSSSISLVHWPSKLENTVTIPQNTMGLLAAEHHLQSVNQNSIPRRKYDIHTHTCGLH